MTDDRPLSSDEMLRRAREGLARPMESAAPPQGPNTQEPAPPVSRRPAKSPRLRPPPRPTPANPAHTRLVVAIAVVIAIIGAGVAILAATVATSP